MEANRVYCLYRVSTAKQVDHDALNQADIPMQRIACHEFAEQMAWEIVQEEQENGISGYKVSANDRDKIQLIKEHALQNKFDILLVFMFDRIGRIASETPFIVEWFVQQGIHVWSVKEGEQRFDSHVDRLTNFIRYWQADGESQKTSMRVKEKRKQMAMEGLFCGGSVPYGYKLVPTGLKNKRKADLCTFAVNDDEAVIVKLMFEKTINDGLGRWALTTYLNGRGIKNREGQNWTHCTVGRILKNVCYLGIVKSGETSSKPIPELQIIGNDIFETAQRLINVRCNNPKECRTLPFKTSGTSLLSGNVFCGHCGSRLTLTTNGKVNAKLNGERVKRMRVRYVCFGKTRNRTICDGQTGYTMSKLDSMIEEIIIKIFSRMKAVPESRIISACSDRVVNELDTQLREAKADYNRLVKELDVLHGELVKVLMGQSEVPKDFLSETIKSTQIKRQDAETRMKDAQNSLDASNSRAEAFHQRYEKILSWAELFEEADIKVKKMIAGYLIDRVEVKRDYELTVNLNMDVRQFLEGIDCYDSDIANGGAPGLRALPQKNRYSRATESICTIK